MRLPGGADKWLVSSYSQQGENCVEVALDAAVVDVRDTKDRDGGELTVTGSAWTALLDAVK